MMPAYPDVRQSSCGGRNWTCCGCWTPRQPGMLREMEDDDEGGAITTDVKQAEVGAGLIVSELRKMERGLGHVPGYAPRGDAESKFSMEDAASADVAVAATQAKAELEALVTDGKVAAATINPSTRRNRRSGRDAGLQRNSCHARANWLPTSIGR